MKNVDHNVENVNCLSSNPPFLLCINWGFCGGKGQQKALTNARYCDLSACFQHCAYRDAIPLQLGHPTLLRPWLSVHTLIRNKSIYRLKHLLRPLGGTNLFRK